MTFIRFLFILALAVPLSVFMVYLLNKLATEFNDQQKKVKEDKENVGSSRTSHDSVHRERVPRRQAADVKTEKKSKRQRRKERKLKKKDKEK